MTIIDHTINNNAQSEKALLETSDCCFFCCCFILYSIQSFLLWCSQFTMLIGCNSNCFENRSVFTTIKSILTTWDLVCLANDTINFYCYFWKVIYWCLCSIHRVHFTFLIGIFLIYFYRIPHRNRHHRKSMKGLQLN